MAGEINRQDAMRNTFDNVPILRKNDELEKWAAWCLQIDLCMRICGCEFTITDDKDQESDDNDAVREHGKENSSKKVKVEVNEGSQRRRQEWAGAMVKQCLDPSLWPQVEHLTTASAILATMEERTRQLAQLQYPRICQDFQDLRLQDCEDFAAYKNQVRWLNEAMAIANPSCKFPESCLVQKVLRGIGPGFEGYYRLYMTKKRVDELDEPVELRMQRLEMESKSQDCATRRRRYRQRRAAA